MDDGRLQLFLKAAPKETIKAAKAAMRRAAQAASTEMLKAMAQSSWLARKDLKGGLLKPIFSDVANGVQALIKVRGKGFGMDHYKVRPKGVTAKKGRRPKQWTPPSWQTGPTGSWHTARGAFMAIMKNGTKPLLMQREGRKLRRLYGPSPQYFAAFRTVQARVAKRAREVFPRRFEHEITRLLGGG